MAEALVKNLYSDKHVHSAGLSAMVGSPADESAIQLMTEKGLDITSHIARQIDKEMVANADLILTMSIEQTKWIEKNWVFAKGKTFRIGHWTGKDIEDPYRKPLGKFVEVLDDIEHALKGWQEKIE